MCTNNSFLARLKRNELLFRLFRRPTNNLYYFTSSSTALYFNWLRNLSKSVLRCLFIWKRYIRCAPSGSNRWFLFQQYNQSCFVIIIIKLYAIYTNISDYNCMSGRFLILIFDYFKLCSKCYILIWNGDFMIFRTTIRPIFKYICFRTTNNWRIHINNHTIIYNCISCIRNTKRNTVNFCDQIILRSWV